MFKEYDKVRVKNTDICGIITNIDHDEVTILMANGSAVRRFQEDVTADTEDQPAVTVTREFVKNDSGKNPLHLLPTVALERIGEVLAFGAQKYTEHGWRKVDNRSRYYSAVLRHLFAWWRGEQTDPESGLSHLAHAGCSLLFLLESYDSNLGKDDRPNNEKPVV